jgi:hypothetical protein
VGLRSKEVEPYLIPDTFRIASNAIDLICLLTNVLVMIFTGFSGDSSATKPELSIRVAAKVDQTHASQCS